MSTMAQIKAMKAEYQKKIETEGKAALKEEFTAFFRDNPKITAVRWRQYTPYFNDGDPCTFGVGEFTYKIDGKLDDGGDYEDGFYSTWVARSRATNVWLKRSRRPFETRTCSSRSSAIMCA
jgi:hypothetical protein